MRVLPVLIILVMSAVLTAHARRMPSPIAEALMRAFSHLAAAADAVEHEDEEFARSASGLYLLNH